MHEKLALAVLLSIPLLFCCNGRTGNGSTGGKQTVTIAGSTSVMPFTEKLAEHFMVDHPQFVINVQGGGSTAGIQACMNNTVNIGMTSRELKPEEKVLKDITICYDGIAIVVHPTNPIRELSLRQVQDIFSGHVKKWSEIGWVDRRMDAVTREEGSGTRASFEELAMKGKDIDDAIMVQDSNGSVKEVVATDPYAIGYISHGLVDKRVKALTIDGIIPSLENMKTKKYKFVRPFIYITQGEPTLNAKIFIDFVLSRDGQNILKKEGLIGIQ